MCTINKEGKIVPKTSTYYNCFLYALQQSKVPKQTINNIQHQLIDDSYMLTRNINKIRQDYKLNIYVKQYKPNVNNDHQCVEMSDKNKGWTKVEGKRIDLCLAYGHYFIDCDIEGITEYFLNNYAEIMKVVTEHPEYNEVNNNNKLPKFCSTNQIVNGKLKFRQSRSTISSKRLVQLLFENNMLEHIYLGDVDYDICKISSVGIKANKEILPIDDVEPFSKLIAKDNKVKQLKSKKFERELTFFADFESCFKEINGELVHVPFMLCVRTEHIENNSNKAFSNTYIGFDCFEQMMDKYSKVKNTKYTIYFHNLCYDGRFAIKLGAKKIIPKGNKYFEIDIADNIVLKDSCALIADKLSKFPELFPNVLDPKQQRKELFPYNFLHI